MPGDIKKITKFYLLITRLRGLTEVVRDTYKRIKLWQQITL